jgi:hypothetical protein
MDPEKSKAAHRKWQKKHEALEAGVVKYESGLQSTFESFLASPNAHVTNSWSVLEVATIKSKAGASFKALGDSSYLVQGANEDEDVYTIVGSTTLKRMSAIRLDALSDASMPHGGPGRAENGNFALSKVRVFTQTGKEKIAEHEVKISKAEADFEQNKSNLAIAASIDDDLKTGWAVDPQFGKDHAAMFTFEKPIDLTNGMALKIVLDFRVNKKHNIGRPRISVSGDDKPSLKNPVMPARVAELMTKQNVSTSEDRALVFNWWKQTDGGWRGVNAKVEEHSALEPNGESKALVCAEGYTPLRMYTQGADFFEQTYILKRGNTDMKDGVASQAFLQVVSPGGSPERWKMNPPKGAKFSGRRATLANWIVDTNGGAGILAARVMVNRLWQHHFGRGIVETPNDFGHAGALPTHPELLDFLAGELLRNGWKLKPIQKLIMTSATYMQSTAPNAKKDAADPENKYFCRRTPKRLEGEAIRDCMLAVSGALDATMFGPGTKDEHSKRRSIYFTIKRSQLMGSMVAFDCPEPLVSQGFRPTTTVAPQALMILNGPQVREWAEALAKRVESKSESECVERAYEIALGRKPTRTERRDAEVFLEKQAKGYGADPRVAMDTKGTALIDLCQVLFGLNEFVYEN